MQGEAASAHVAAAASYPDDIANIISKSGYTTQQVFTVDETVFYWEKMPPKTVMTRKKSMSGFKLQKTD